MADFSVAVMLPFAREAHLPVDELPEIRRWHDRLTGSANWKLDASRSRPGRRRRPDGHVIPPNASTEEESDGTHGRGTRPMARGAPGAAAQGKGIDPLRDELNAARRALPWVRIDKEYVFDGPAGRETLAELFEGRSQLVVKHFMLAPGQKDPCVGCSFESDIVDGMLVHLEHHDVSYVAAPTTT